MKRLTFIACAIIMLAACNSEPPPTPFDLNQMATETAAAIPTATITPTPTITLTPSITPTLTPTFTLTPPPPRNPPTIDAIDDQSCKTGDTLEIDIRYDDPDDGLVTVDIESSNTAIASARLQSENILRVDCTNSGTAAITINAEDPDGDTTRRTFNVEVITPNQPPRLTSFSEQRCNSGQLIELVVSATDPDGDAVTFEASHSNAAVARAEMEGANLLRITCVGGGTAAVTVSADDGRGGIVTANIPVAVDQPNRPPSIEMISNQTCDPGDILEVAVSASDPDDDGIMITPQFTDQTVAYADMIDIDTLRVTCVGAGVSTITLTINDGYTQVGINFDVTVIQYNEPPTIDPIPNQACDPGNTLDLSVTFNDPDGDGITIAPTFYGYEAIARADMLSINTARVTCIGGGVAIITLTITDVNGASNSTSFEVNVTVPTATPTLTPEPISATYTTYDDAATILILVNQARAEASLGALTLNAQLNQAALNHNIDMSANSFFDHTGSNGSSPGDRISAAGYSWSAVGENIAGGDTSAQQAFNGWMGSDAHRANILNPNFTEMGLSHISRTGSTWGHYWTQTFGRP